jgi:NB-ARC domain
MLNARTKAIAVRARIQPPFLRVSSVLTRVVILGYTRKPIWYSAEEHATMSVNQYAQARILFLRELPSLLLTTFYRKHTLGHVTYRFTNVSIQRVQMSEENSFGYILKSFRVRKGTKRGTQWTQEQFGARLDPSVSRVTINRWETNVCLPTLEHLEQLVTVLELNEEDTIALYSAAKLEPPKRRNLSPRNRLFTGREKYLEQVANHFKTDTTVVLSGLGGIGKTQLALEYAYRHFPNVYRAVLWVNADKAALQASYADMAEVLRLPERNERELDKRIHAVNRWLEDHTNWLLIMDNADDLPLVRSFFPKADHGHILLTTRTQMVGSIASKIEIEAMDSEEGQLFLLRRSDPLKGRATLDKFAADIRKPALQLAELLGGHPLALDQAGAYIEDGSSFTDYIRLYYEQRLELLDERGSLKGADCDYPETVVVTFELCFRKASKRHALATDILRFCAFLHPDAIPAELFQHDDNFKLDTAAFRKGITALLRY